MLKIKVIYELVNNSVVQKHYTYIYSTFYKIFAIDSKITPSVISFILYTQLNDEQVVCSKLPEREKKQKQKQTHATSLLYV